MTMEEETVFMEFPRETKLTLHTESPLTGGEYRGRIPREPLVFSAGIHPVPKSLADHPYLKQCGVKLYTGPVVAEDPAIVERHDEDLRIAEQANADRVAKSFREHAQGTEDRAATVAQRGAEELDRRRLEAGIV
jgi:hypothetical protein